MSVITNIIPPQGDELIRDRLGAILRDETQAQYQQYNSDAFVESVWIERNTPFEATELPAINVSTPDGDYGNSHQGSVDGTYTFFIDVHTQGEAIEGGATINVNGGDVRANFLLKRLLGICRYIIADPKYKTLGFAAPFISWVRVVGYNIKPKYNDKNGQDASVYNSSMGRLTVSVKANQTNTLIDPPLLDSTTTQWQLYLTPQGYMYGPTSGGPPPLNPNFAYIVDQEDNILAAVPGGQKYPVTVIRRIIDTITANQTNITDNIIP